MTHYSHEIVTSKLDNCGTKNCLAITMKFPSLGLLLALIALPQVSQAWWNDDWTSRKKISLDTTITGADTKEPMTDFPVLVRLHPGNFSYFSEVNKDGNDIRMMADDKTPLKFQIEKFDGVNEMALVWVRQPNITPGANTDGFYMYYGNEDAPKPAAGNDVYSDDFVAVYHFSDEAGPPQDATAYANHGDVTTAQPDPTGWIGGALKFAGSTSLSIKPAPSLAIDPQKGWTFAAWIKADQLVGDTYILNAVSGSNELSLLTRNNLLIARYSVNGQVLETAPADLGQPGQWHHVGLVLRADKVELFFDGANTSSVPVAAQAMNPQIILGASAAGGNFQGSIDEVQISKVQRHVDWMKLLHRSQSPDFMVTTMGQDESGEAGGGVNSFAVIVANVTIDGWIVIGLTMIMFVVAMIVMVVKIIVIGRTRKDNKAFMTAYDALESEDDIASLDREVTEEERALQDSEFLTAVLGSHDHYQSSPLYQLYHTGIREIKKRVKAAKGQTSLTPESINVIRVMLDSILVREGQKLNSNLVLLTIAIAGGPFLGLLGTVVGVMITFAVIAASGNVDINSIAPGIAAALLATVAGLAVAIPALFAYNYLLVQIKDIQADMRVFADEFLAMLEEKAVEHLGGSKS